MPGMPRIPGLGDSMKMVQAQSELITELPKTIAELQRAVKGLAEALAATKETVASTHRVSARLESVLDDIEEPLRSLRPGIERLAVVLNDPAIDRIPDALRSIEQTVGPVNEGVQRLRVRSAELTRPVRSVSERVRAVVRQRTSGRGSAP